MSAWAKLAAIAVVVVSSLMAGCALPQKHVSTGLEEASTWRGRLAIRIDADQPQSFSAGFELTGSASAGNMTIFNPLGGTYAVLTWNTQTATMQANGTLQNFQSLSELIERAVGAAIPVDALFAWLAGEIYVMDGWNPDLSQHAKGRITARRIKPAPLVELRLVLDN